MLKIGISSCFMYPDPSRIVFGHKTLSYLENDMARYVSNEDVFPVLIPELDDHLLKPILNELDGFVFQGGTDLASATYGEEPIVPGKWLGDQLRDTYELRIMDYAFRNQKPIFAICRGMQLLNVFMGGSLYQDLDTQYEKALKHRDADLYDRLRHDIEFTEDGLLGKIYKTESRKMVNSVHHQAVKDLGKDLSIMAISPEDGVVEAIECTSPGNENVFGVQWHPEFSPTLSSENILIDESILMQHFLDTVRLNKS